MKKGEVADEQPPSELPPPVLIFKIDELIECIRKFGEGADFKPLAIAARAR